MAPTQLSSVLEGLLNELGIADLSTLEAMLKHDTGAVLDAIRSTAAAAEAGAAVYASSATSNVVVCPSSTATAGVISGQHNGSISRTLVSTDAQTTLKGSDIHAAASSASAEVLLRQELEEKLRSQTKELASEQRSASAVKKALASARDELAAAQELRRSDCDNLRRAQQAAKRDIKARLSGWPTRQIMQLELSVSGVSARCGPRCRPSCASSSTRCRFRWRQRRGALMPQRRRGQGCTTRWRGLYAHATEVDSRTRRGAAQARI